jgi:hypothetical protein
LGQTSEIWQRQIALLNQINTVDKHQCSAIQDDSYAWHGHDWQKKSYAIACVAFRSGVTWDHD